MSCELLQQLNAEGALSPNQFQDIFSLSRSGAYRYFESTELPYSKLRSLFRLAKDGRVAECFLDDLLPGTGWLAYRPDINRDINGDGRIDFNDAIASGIAQVAESGNALQTVHNAAADGKLDADESDRALNDLDRVIREALITREILFYLRDLQQPKQARRDRLIGGAR